MISRVIQQYLIIIKDQNKRLVSTLTMSNVKNRLKLNAEKQKRFREKQKTEGKKLVRGYLNKDALDCYEELRVKTGWTDADLLSNSLQITYAAYKCGQIKLLNEWLKKNRK